MKIGPAIYHLNIFHLNRYRGGREWAGKGGGGVGIQKPIKKCHQINIISALTRPNNRLKNAMKVRFFLLWS